jgi:hypothetical protein
MKFMRRLLLVSVVSLIVLLLAGCYSDAGKKYAVDVIIDGNGQFPSFLVGKWRADGGIWEFTLEPDGAISSAAVSLGQVRLKPGRVTTIPMRLGGKGLFKPGRWAVQYLQLQRQLVVEIVIDYFRIELGKDIVQGKTLDFFVGIVSDDGTYWPAEWYSFPEYVVNTKSYHNYELPFDPNDNPRGNLIFRKVAESK